MKSADHYGFNNKEVKKQDSAKQDSAKLQEIKKMGAAAVTKNLQEQQDAVF